MVIGCVFKNWLGDVIFLSPVLRVLRSNFPAATIVCLAPERCLDLLRTNPCVDRVMLFDERRAQRSIGAKIKLIRELRQLHFDQVYLFHRSFTRALIFFLAAARERIGYATKGRRFLLTTPVSEPEEKMHAVDYGLELLRRYGLRVHTDALYDFHFEKPDLERVKELLLEHQVGTRRLVAINPGANWPPKRWPLEYFEQLAKELVRRYDVQVVVSGSLEDKPLGARIVEGLHDGRIVSLCGETKLRELGALFSLCALVISSDSGPLHIAGGVGTNVLGIFGPTDPALTGPRGRGKNIVLHDVPHGEKVPWYGKHFPGDWMRRITLDDVLKTIEREKLL